MTCGSIPATPIASSKRTMVEPTSAKTVVGRGPRKAISPPRSSIGSPPTTINPTASTARNRTTQRFEFLVKVVPVPSDAMTGSRRLAVRAVTWRRILMTQRLSTAGAMAAISRASITAPEHAVPSTCIRTIRWGLVRKRGSTASSGTSRSSSRRMTPTGSTRPPTCSSARKTRGRAGRRSAQT